MQLFNIYDKKLLKEKLMNETFKRITISFYRYVIIDQPHQLRDELYAEWAALNVFGRTYLAQEGINAQMSVPEHHWDEFMLRLQARKYFENMPIKRAVEDDGKSFYKLKVKVRNKIVADGLDDGTFDVTNVGRHLTAREFNEALADPNTIVVDMRNHYESEIGHFENAICPDVDTFKEELPAVEDMLKGKEDKKLLLYCTGGIRCEKASAYFKHKGFKDVNQLHGGIIDYARQIEAEGLENKFKGKNFVFDERLGESISGEIISECHQCGAPCDTHTNCANDDCHLLFIQCEACATKMDGCCTDECKTIANLPMEEQRALRKGKLKTDAHSVYKSRLRPNLKNLRNQKV
ncbi:rhodanese-related sulfurtransferase [Cryomorphaceae bacterium S-15]|uniref:tRNA uridine(34) hydroxylase n=2 Tax=Acidiluteibacter ferrifornacis TaxID=2692424 RepID=A0A6N9NH10_9FLAO|nr:rhodanese-related sulfurtransferase [Acidiluteibacter ferrifornacis]NBG64487.1 rhodanese-related sulfurtransferase [Acidiluteibacter ferrifornacis]